MAIERRLMTAEELEQLPTGMGVRYELIDGELRTMAPPGGPHGWSGGAMSVYLGQHIFASGLGHVFLAETGFLIRRDPDRVRAPDFAFVRWERLGAEGPPRGYVPIPPDLVLEVVSPGDAADETREQVQDWLDFGCRAVWVLYAGPRLDVYGSGAASYGPEDEVDGGELLPGFRMRLADMVRPTRR